MRFRVDIPPASRLSFASVSPEFDAHGTDLGPTTFRVRLDGRTIVGARSRGTIRCAPRWNGLALDAAGAHELAFEIEGRRRP